METFLSILRHLQPFWIDFNVFFSLFKPSIHANKSRLKTWDYRTNNKSESAWASRWESSGPGHSLSLWADGPDVTGEHRDDCYSHLLWGPDSEPPAERGSAATRPLAAVTGRGPTAPPWPEGAARDRPSLTHILSAALDWPRRKLVRIRWNIVKNQHVTWAESERCTVWLWNQNSIRAKFMQHIRWEPGLHLDADWLISHRHITQPPLAAWTRWLKCLLVSDGDIFLKVEPRHEARVLVAQARQVTHPHLERSENVCLSQEFKKKTGTTGKSLSANSWCVFILDF